MKVTRDERNKLVFDQTMIAALMACITDMRHIEPPSYLSCVCGALLSGVDVASRCRKKTSKVNFDNLFQLCWFSK